MQSVRALEACWMVALISALALTVLYFWIRSRIPGYRAPFLKWPSEQLRLLRAYADSPRSETEKRFVTAIYISVFVIFALSAVASMVLRMTASAHANFR